MDLDVVEPGLLGAQCCLDEFVPHVVHLGGSDLFRDGVWAFAAVEGQLSTLGGNGRGPHCGIHEPVALGLGAGVHQLREDPGTGGVDAFHNFGPGPGLVLCGDTGLEEVTLAVGGVRVDALGDQQAKAPRAKAW